MLNERWRRSSVQSSRCQHVATLQFGSSAGKDHAYSGQHPCFAPNWFIQFRHTWRWMCILSKYHIYTKLFVFLCGCASNRQDLPKASPRAISVWTTAKLIVPMKEGWWKLRMLMYDEFNVPTCWQHFSLSAVQRKTFCAEQSWWPEFDMFGSMPWCAFPWHKLLPRLAQKNCCTVYHPNLIHECTSFFSTKVIFEGLPRKAFPRK